MKKKNIIIVVLLVLTGINTSCEDFLDINNDPNFTTSAAPEQIFPSAVLSTSGQIGGPYNILGCVWSQYCAQSNIAGQYIAFDSYNITSESLNNSFQNIYTGALNDYVKVIELSTARADWGINLMATVMKAFTMQIMNDLYGDLPYSQAFRGTEGVFHPGFDKDGAIYDQLITEIDAALAKDFSASTVRTFTNIDYVFGGNLDSWIKFANTLKLKIYLRQRFVRPDVSTAGIRKMLDSPDFAGFLDDAANVDVFTDAPNKSNPMYEDDRRRLNTTTNLAASWTTMSFLLVNNDTIRLDSLYDAGSGGQTGIVQGNFNASNDDYPSGALSLIKLNPTDPVYLINKAESYFLQAEADLIYNGGASTQNLYEQGIRAIYEGYNISDSIFTADTYAFPATGTNEEKFEAIMVQKWSSMIRIQGWEAFIERTRTGYPRSSSLTAAAVEADKTAYQTSEAGRFIYPLKGNTGGFFAKKLVYPGLLKNRNTNTPNQANNEVQKGNWWFKVNPNSPISEQ